MSASAEVTTFAPGATIAGRYRVVRLIGSGGMGDVFECKDLENNERRVAVKMYTDVPDLPRDIKAQLVSRFVREGRTTARIASPHVVNVFDVGVDVGGSERPFIAMGLLQGEDLESLIEREGALRPVVAIRIVLQAAWGLLAAHREGIIHRDIKPSNLFLHEDEDGQLTVKIVDFGIAKPAYSDEMLTQTGHILGSPLFMAPEQVTQAKDVDERADIWGLGATLYTALTGAAPLSKVNDVMEVLRELCTKPTPNIQDQAPWITPQVAAIVHGTLLREPERRCPTIAAFIAALEPRSGGTLQLRRSLLKGIPEAQRREKSPRAILPLTWKDVADADRSGQGAEQIDNDDPLVGQTLGGKYRLIRRLGRGGMGAVYEAHAGGERFALKVILDEAAKNPASVRRFVREARATMAIASPHVVKVFEVDVDPERQVPYIVMEMLRGSDLARVIREQGALDPASTVEVFVQIARALTVAHERGIVHRDIKPANIFLHVGDDGSVTAKLCDFGVAKASEEVESTSDRGPALTQTGGFLGSPMYMSPEQAQNAKGSTPQSDVWSLGASLYEALSGRRLWEDSLSVGAVIFAICTAPIVPLRSHATWLPEGLEVAVSKSLERDLAKRWPTAEAFATALLPFMRGNTDETLRPLRLDDLSRKRGADHGSSTPHASGSADTALSWPPGQTPAGSDRPAAAASGSRSPSTAPVQTLSVADFEPERRAGAWIPWAIGGGVLVTLGGLAFMFAAPTVTPAAPTAATSPTASPTDGATAGGASASAGVSPAEGERGTNPGGKSAAKITILPKTAVVTVDGAARRPQGGVISLEGEPGDAFEIKASSGGTSATCKAVFLKDGTASIKTVDATKGSCE